MKFNIYFNSLNETELIKPGEINHNFLGNSAYKKCLPFMLAGKLGWDLILPYKHTVNWNGGDAPEDLNVTAEGDTPFLFSKFGHGILTAIIPQLFELEEDNFLWVKGPNNSPLSLDLYPCEGLVEADWFPGQLAMDYRVLKKNTEIVLEKDTAYCRLVPYPKFYIEKFKPEYKNLATDKEFNEKLSTYNFYDKFFVFSKYFFKSYVNGMLGTKKMKNVPKITLNKPAMEQTSKCPFHNLIKS